VCILPKLGIRFTSEKQQALLQGDTSGTVLNPFFIHAAQSMGMHFCNGVYKFPAMAGLQAKYVQAALERVAEISRGRDWELRAQVALWVASGSILMQLGYLTPSYLEKSCEAVNMAGLQFIPTYGRPPPLSPHLHEKLSVLSQIIYFENFLFLTCGGAHPTMTTRIEKEFRHQLQVNTACHLMFTLRVQHFIIGSISSIVQDLPINDAHPNYFAGQRHGGYARPSTD
jgi:hypothetical protein